MNENLDKIPKLFDSKIAFFFIIFILPFLPYYAYIPISNTVSINIQRVLIIVFIFLGITARLAKNKKLISYSPLKYYIYLYLFSMVVISFFSQIPILSFREILVQIVQNISLYFIIIEIIKTKKDINKLINVLVFSCILISLLGLIEYSMDNRLFHFFTFKKQFSELGGGTPNLVFELRKNRIESSFGHPIGAGIYLNFIMPLIIYKYNLAIRKNRIYFLLALILAMITCILTFSISSIICLTFIIISSILILKPKKRVKLIFIIILCIAILSLLKFTPKLTNYFYGVIKIEGEGGSSLMGRFNYLSSALPIISQRVLFGYGLKATTTTFLYDAGFSDVNYFYDLLLSGGLLLFISFMILLLKTFSLIFNSIKLKIDETKLLVFSLIAISSYLINLTSISLKSGEPYFFIFLGIIISYLKIQFKNLNLNNRLRAKSSLDNNF